MKTLNPTEEKFFLIQTKNPTWSSHTCFLHLIYNKKFSPTEIAQMFEQFVDTKDYQKRDKKALIEYAVGQTA